MTTTLTTLLPRAVNHVSPGLRDAIIQLFATRAFPAFKCDLMVESLLQYAQIEQLTGEQRDRYAKIAIHNLLKTYHTDRTMQEICGYQTLHIFVRLLCALGILIKQSIAGQPTTYLLPLDVDYHFQTSATVLIDVERLCDPEYTKNVKMRKKAHQIKERLLLMNPSLQSIPPCIQSIGDSQFVLPHVESPERDILGDSHTQVLITESPRMSSPGDSTSDTLMNESTVVSSLEDSVIVLAGQKSPSFEHELQEESPNDDKNLPDTPLSSIEFVSIQNHSSQKELELESQMGEPWIGSEEELSQEAALYLMLLDGPEYATPDYLNTHAGKKAIGGYKNKIRRSPWLVRIAAINTLLHCSFYDLTRQKKPLENAGKWFHGSFDRYADPHRPMGITGEILDWAKSPYTIKEIASVLPQERKRQETQWWSSELAHLPFSSCVVAHRYLQEDASVMQMSIAEQQQESFLLEMARQSPGSQWMNYAEAEQLAAEVRHEAYSYLDGIHVYLEPRLGENAYVVEASIAETAFPVVYTVPQDWWQHHQEQMDHQVWQERRDGRKQIRKNERRMV